MTVRRGIVLGLAVMVAACSGGGPGAFSARLDVSGSATVEEQDGEARVVTDSASMDFGDVVTLSAGSATLVFADGSTYELHAGEPASSVRVGAPPELLAGDVLLVDGFPAELRLAGATISTLGPTKVDASGRAATVYVGRATVAGVGDLQEIDGLRQAFLTTGATPEPIVYDDADEWDRRFLSDAVAFGERLEALARGYTGDLPRGGTRGVSFYRAVLPGLRTERSFTADLLDVEREVGETLVGAAITVQGRQQTFRDRWRDVFSFRDAGAVWGLVALDQGVSKAPLLETIEVAIAETNTTTTTAPRPTTTTTTAPVGSTTSTTAPPSTTTSTTTTTAPPGPLDPVLDPVTDLLDELLEAIGLG